MQTDAKKHDDSRTGGKEQTMCKVGKYERDAATVDAILAKKPEEITAADRMQLLMIYSVSFHDSGKIEGTASLDSSCHGCTFCQKMIEAAAKDPEIICGKCYDFRQENYRIAVRKRHELNLRIMSSVSFSVAELAMLPTAMIDRINSSGDMENAVHAGNMIKYAIAHGSAHVGLWAKNDDAVQAAFDQYGKPENVIYISSSPRINHRRRLPRRADYTFTVYDAEHIDSAIASGSMECNGKKCIDCGFKCYYGTWPKGSDIAELLRK